MAPPNKNKVYLVEYEPGKYREFHNWPECQAFVMGKSIPFAGGADLAQARAKLHAAKRIMAAYRGNPGQGPAAKRAAGSQRSVQPSLFATTRPKSGLCSDAGTRGNPGPCEYQVTDIEGNRLLHKHLGIHSNNYAELAGIGAMVQYAISHGETELWTDSTIAMGWIKTGRIGSGIHEPEVIRAMAEKIRLLLASAPQLRLRKWMTREWGQIPADFGRK